MLILLSYPLIYLFIPNILIIARNAAPLRINGSLEKIQYRTTSLRIQGFAF